MDSYLKNFFTVAVIAFGCSLAFLVLSVVIYRFGGAESFGQIGDSHGALNTLFSGLALAGVVVTLMMQTEELKIARQERMDALKTQEEIVQRQESLATATAIDAWSRLAEQELLGYGDSPAKFELAVHRFECRKILESQLGITAFDTNNEEIPAREVAAEAMSLQRLHTFVRQFDRSHRRQVEPKPALSKDMLARVGADLNYRIDCLDPRIDSELIEQCFTAVFNLESVAAALPDGWTEEKEIIDRFVKIMHGLESKVYHRLCCLIGLDPENLFYE